MSSHDVLILSSPEDVHYRAVDWALRSVGIRTALLFGNCFPQDDLHTLFVDGSGSQYERAGPDGERLNLLAAPVVWYRRGHWPVVSPDLLAADVTAAEREAEMFVGGARSIATDRQRWINNPDREHVANRKPYQLDVARRLGLKIPRTLMSNDPERIRAFFQQTAGDVVLKPFHAIQWLSDDAHYILFAKKLRFEDIVDPEALRLTSHIFQEYVEKRYELRIFCFGGTIFPFKLHSQAQAATQTDWRVSTDGSLKPEPYPGLPETVGEAIRQYMRHMGLEYGAFDFIVDKYGDYVFLECNVSGQFLFLEEWNPEIRILSRFVQFLLGGLEISNRQRRMIEELHYLDFYRSAETRAYYDAVSARYLRQAVSRNLHREAEDA